MGWPKGKKRTEKAEAKLVEVAPVIAQEKKKEQTAIVNAVGTCRTCGHGDKLHYEGRDRQCNSEGCRCSRMMK